MNYQFELNYEIEYCGECPCSRYDGYMGAFCGILHNNNSKSIFKPHKDPKINFGDEPPSKCPFKNQNK